MTSHKFIPSKQQKNVINKNDTAFISACPGAGKTRVIVDRAAKLLQKGSEDRGIALLSFTREAISELGERLQNLGLLQVPHFPHFIGTFDSFVWQFIVAPFGFPDLGCTPRLIPDLEKKEIRPFDRAHPLPLSCFIDVTHEIDAIAAAKKGFKVSSKKEWQLRQYQTTAKNCRERHLSKGELSFDGARSIAKDMLLDRSFAFRLGQALAGRFKEILVDEAQDCNPDDLDIISWLISANIPVKVICDPQQSIYSFRGGVTDHLDRFSERFEETNRLELTGNYRSSPNICKAVSVLRPIEARTMDDLSVGKNKNCKLKIEILAYSGQSVSAIIGEKFGEMLAAEEFDPRNCPILASTRDSASKAAGRSVLKSGLDKTLRFATAVSEFHRAIDIGEVKNTLEKVHAAMLEIEGRLAGQTYHQYVLNNDIDSDLWRAEVLNILRELRWDTERFEDADEWLSAAREIMSPRLLADVGSIRKRMRNNRRLIEYLVKDAVGDLIPSTIHAVKGRQFPAVCVVTTPQTFASILDFLTDGTKREKAEDARKIYVAASRAKKLLVFAVPKSRSAQFANHIRSSGADVATTEL